MASTSERVAGLAPAVSTPIRRGPPAGRPLTNRWLLRLASLVIGLVAWEIVGANINPIFLSTPTKISAALVELIRNGQLVNALGISFAGMAIGFGAAVLTGIPVGILMGRSRTL